MKAAILCFLAMTAAFATDSLTISPSSPTTKDSVTFGLFSDRFCCCTQYLNKTLTVNDSTLTLQYVPNSTACALCDCFAAGSWTTFTSAPLKAGVYNVYRLEIAYCPPGQICPLGVLVPVKMGRFTVREFTSTEEHAPVAAELFTVSPNPFRSTVTIRPGTAFSAGRIFLYDIQGHLLNKWEAQGHDITWNARSLACGLYVMKAIAGDKTLTRSLLLQK